MLNIYRLFTTFSLLFYLLKAENNKEIIKLEGAGASTPFYMIQNWDASFVAYRSKFKTIVANYRNLGSAAGLCRIKNTCEQQEEPLVYASTLLDLVPADHIAYPTLVSFPIYAIAAAVMYNIPGVTNLNISGQDLVDIYRGTLTWWNDTRLQERNLQAQLPGEMIRPVIRSDDCGMTQIFTSALSAFSSQWNQTYGIFQIGRGFPSKLVKYETAFKAIGMSGILSSFDYSIGYGSHADAIQFGIDVASITNKRNKLIAHQLIEQGVESAMNYFAAKHETRITNADTDDAYPIALYGYLVVNITTTPAISCEQMVEFVRFIEYCLTDPKTHLITRSYQMIPLTPPIIQQIVTPVLKNITCSNGRETDVYRLKQAQETEENKSVDFTPLLIKVIVPIVLLLFLFITFLFGFQNYRINKLIKVKYWLIPANDIFVPVQQQQQYSSKRELESRFSCIDDIDAIGFFTNTEFVTDLHYKGHKILLIKDRCQLSPQNYSTESQKLLHSFLIDRNNENLLKFYGVTVSPQSSLIYFVFQFPERKSLHDVLVSSRFEIGNDLKMCLIQDCLAGMIYLHKYEIVHGCLNSITCCLDANWTLKLAQWNQTKLCEVEKLNKYTTILDCLERNVEIQETDYLKVFYTDPNLLKTSGVRVEKPHDIYSFGVLIIEIFTCVPPFFGEIQVSNETEIEVMTDIIHRGRAPKFKYQSIPIEMQTIIENCQLTAIDARPTFQYIKTCLQQQQLVVVKGAVETMMKHMEKYLVTLEEKVEDRVHELRSVSLKMENLLQAILPKEVAVKLQNGEYVAPELFEESTVFFSDIPEFATMSTVLTAYQLVSFLNSLYTMFDDIIETFDVYKLETIGDSYVVVSGIPRRNGRKHASEITKMALCFLRAANSFIFPKLSEITTTTNLKIRIGINSGPCTAGVVGLKMPRYCLFGDTINTSSRMKSTSLPNKIQASETTIHYLNKTKEFEFQFRGAIPVKGKGTMNTYWINSVANQSKSQHQIQQKITEIGMKKAYQLISVKKAYQVWKENTTFLNKSDSRTSIIASD